MINLSEIDKNLFINQDNFENWSESLVNNGRKKPIGFDIETDGEDFPKTELAGFSLYDPEIKSACYVPINHIQITNGYPRIRLDFESGIGTKLQKIFTENIMVTHGGAYDFLLMNKLGFKFYEVIDSLLLSLAMQFQNLGLKDLVLEFGVAKYTDVIQYKVLMEKLGFPEKHVDFSAIEIVQDYYDNVDRLAFNYAINDPIFTLHLAEILYQKYTQYIGTTAASWIHQSQVNTMLLLCESSARGFYSDKEFLVQFINQYGKELDLLEKDLMNQVRKVMGWV